MENMKNFAVIDTETNWCNKVMSVGVVIADCETFQPVGAKYYMLTQECAVGGMYACALQINGNPPAEQCSRDEAIKDLRIFLEEYNVHSIFAYNACFDYGHLCELADFTWHDIIRIAAYRQYNSKIPETAECCRTGRLKRNYGVEPVMRMLSGNYGYFETHNALFDAIDELRIMQLLGLTLDTYNHAIINAEEE